MKRSLSALLVVTATWLAPFGGLARAQMDFSLDEEAPPEEPPPEEGGEGEEGGSAGGSFADLATAASDTEVDTDIERERITESAEEIYAVQQIYALRLNRVELGASVAATLNDPYVRHPALEIRANYWWTNVLSLGLNFLWYQWSSDPNNNATDLNFFVRRSFRLGVPVNEWQMATYLNFTYVPIYGKFSAFNRFIFQYDAYLVGGVGFMRTRPIPIIDPAFREFDFQMRAAFNVGLGVRIFLTRFATVFIEFRDYMFLERFESVDIPVSEVDRGDPDTWYADEQTLFNNVSVQVGFTLFFPFTFEYRLPK